MEIWMLLKKNPDKLAFGSDGNSKSQTRGLLEVGILF